jgi:3-oxoacyl-[acyl-carrier protein] reductase
MIEYSKILKNKTTIITGSNRGIGKSIVENFAFHGSNIIACSRKFDKNVEKFNKSIQEKFKIKIDNYFFDLSNKDEIKKFYLDINEKYETIDVLINNAGIIKTNLFQMSKTEEIEDIFKINFINQIYLTQFIVKKMSKVKNSSIINISSSSIYQIPQGRLSYTASKSAMISATKTMSKELARYKIRCNAICPGVVNTDMKSDGTNKEYLENIHKYVSLGRVAEPHEIANCAVFLASDMSSYVNGEILKVDGGII